LASKCLGSIGPLDLNTMVLASEPVTSDISQALVGSLLDLIHHRDHEVSNAAIYGLKRVLATRGCQMLYEAEARDALKVKYYFRNIFFSILILVLKCRFKNN
jgi:hypothetical protein